MKTKDKILVVDDEATLCDTLAFNLRLEGYVADTAYSAEEALALDLSGYDLILLDIMMGDISGIQLAGILKSNPTTASIPLIFCTAKDSEEDIVSGLDLGADDYIMKPYSLKVMLSRIRAVLKRRPAECGEADAKPQADDGTVACKGLVLSPRCRTCTVDGREVNLPRKEFEILLKLMSNIGKIYSRAQLLEEIWPEDTVVVDRVIDVNITRLRRKIGPYGRQIVTRSGYGYGFIE